MKLNQGEGQLRHSAANGAARHRFVEFDLLMNVQEITNA